MDGLRADCTICHNSGRRARYKDRSSVLKQRYHTDPDYRQMMLDRASANYRANQAALGKTVKPYEPRGSQAFRSLRGANQE